MADCEFCGSGVDVEGQDMGEGRVMLLCASCRANIAAGEERDTTCDHQWALMWNPFNSVTQCHRCGQLAERAPSRLEIARYNWQSRWWSMQHWAIRHLLGLCFCHSCSGYFHALSMMRPDYPDTCQNCYARDWAAVSVEALRESEL